MRRGQWLDVHILECAGGQFTPGVVRDPCALLRETRYWENWHPRPTSYSTASSHRILASPEKEEGGREAWIKGEKIQKAGKDGGKDLLLEPGPSLVEARVAAPPPGLAAL